MYINNDTTIVVSYLVYLLISVTLTVWVARTLHKRGAIFLVDAFQGNAELAASVNHLLVVGFYLINIGFVTLALKSNATVTSSRAAIEMLSDKLGFVLITLGAMHFFNLFVFSRIRAHGQHNGPRRPPVAPDAVLKGGWCRSVRRSDSLERQETRGELWKSSTYYMIRNASSVSG